VNSNPVPHSACVQTRQRSVFTVCPN